LTSSRAGALCAVCAALAIGAGLADEPKNPGLSESIQIGLVPLEVTVWPKDGSADACRGLGIDDFRLHVDGKDKALYAVDAMGELQELYRPEGEAAAEATGLSFVLFFDLWHLDVFVGGACPATKPLAFDEARKLVREQFHDGDRLLLVTFSGWPVIHEGWLRTQSEALAALDRLSHDPVVVSGRREHSHHNEWIAGIESFFTGIGRYPGRKDVIYLGDDFRFDDVAVRMYGIAARAQANGVVVSAVDLLESCRSIPGPPGCEGEGLGCSEFRQPVALSPISRDTGGRLFRNPSIAAAAAELRAMRSCRYLVTFRADEGTSKRPPRINLELRENRRKGLTLYAPSSYQTAATAPTRKETDEALFLLPDFSRGVTADVTLWPYRPMGKNDRWKVFAVVRLDRAKSQPLPDEVSRIELSVLLHRQSKGYGRYAKTIAGKDLASFKAKGGTGVMLFPLEGIKTGTTTLDLNVKSNLEDVAANVSKVVEVPRPPGEGETGPWYLSTRSRKLGDNDVLAPSFANVASTDDLVTFVGYGCRFKEKHDDYAGSLVPGAGGDAIAIPLAWLKPVDGSERACGWLAGQVPAPLSPGTWRFKPPANPAGSAVPGDVEFTVTAAKASP
jgi:hypothetical protein